MSERVSADPISGLGDRVSLQAIESVILDAVHTEYPSSAQQAIRAQAFSIAKLRRIEEAARAVLDEARRRSEGRPLGEQLRQLEAVLGDVEN